VDATLARREPRLVVVKLVRWAFAVGLTSAAIAGFGCSGDGAPDDHGADFIQRPGSRLAKVQTVGLAAFGPINPHTAGTTDAIAAFGDPSSARRIGARCSRRWHDLGLRIVFATGGGDDPCGSSGVIGRIEVAGRAAAAAGWRTAEGIRPGMPVSAARRRYPDARRAGGELILVEGPKNGDSGAIVTVLAVATAAGEVTRMTFPIRGGTR
jgi:hypothetical protein